MNLLINYANDLFRESQKLNSRSGNEVGLFDKVISYSPKDIGRDFFERNRKILTQKKGNGFWLWKPYLIKKSLELLNDGDFLFYSDAGSYFIRPITPLIEISLQTGQDLLAFDASQIEKNYTKRDVFILLDSDSPDYTDSHQRMASFSLWRKSSYTMTFIDEYLHYAQDERLITDMENQCEYPNYPGFVEHRHDQSIFSILTKKRKIDIYRDPSQWGNGVKQLYNNSKYEQLIEHTRCKSNKYLARLLKKYKY